jgi:hypothetical protein
VDYNSNPHLPPLWNSSTVRMPEQTAVLPLVRVLTVTRAIHKVRRCRQPSHWPAC